MWIPNAVFVDIDVTVFTDIVDKVVNVIDKFDYEFKFEFPKIDFDLSCIESLCEYLL